MLRMMVMLAKGLETGIIHKPGNFASDSIHLVHACG